VISGNSETGSRKKQMPPAEYEDRGDRRGKYRALDEKADRSAASASAEQR
jgi:hypothetical protein